MRARIRGLVLVALICASSTIPAAAWAAPRLGAADRKSIDRLVATFIRAGIERRDPLKAYALASPALRAGATKAQWARGDLPVMPYPSRLAPGWAVTSVSADGVHLDVTVRKAAQVAEIYDMVVKRVHGRWLVDSAVPRVALGSGGQVTSFKDFGPGQTGSSRPRLSKVWIVLPAALVAAFVLVPFGVVGVRSARDRRAVRRSS